MQVAEALPVFKIDENYIARLDDLPSASNKVRRAHELKVDLAVVCRAGA